LSPAVAVAPAPASPASAKPPEPDRPPLSILGTVLGRSNAIGVFMEDANKNVLRLHTGQDYAGWVLRAVKRRQVNLEKGSAIATLSLPAPGEEGGRTDGAPPASGRPSAPPLAGIAQVAASPVARPDRRRRD
jgi:general secretion pathway protein N